MDIRLRITILTILWQSVQCQDGNSIPKDCRFYRVQELFFV